MLQGYVGVPLEPFKKPTDLRKQLANVGPNRPSLDALHNRKCRLPLESWGRPVPLTWFPSAQSCGMLQHVWQMC